jgi:hypothetical protein
MCVCMSVTKLAGLYVENKVLLGILWHFQDMYYVNFVENALFKSSVNIF